MLEEMRMIITIIFRAQARDSITIPFTDKIEQSVMWLCVSLNGYTIYLLLGPKDNFITTVCPRMLPSISAAMLDFHRHLSNGCNSQLNTFQ